MNILLPGQYPRSEALIAATRNYDRKRLSLDDLEQVYREDLHLFKEVQKGFPYLSPGLSHWQDLMRPFTEILTHTRAGTLTRFYETNTFWRMLEGSEETQIDESKLEDWVETYFLGQGAFSSEDPLVFTLPFLFVFKDFSRGISYERIAGILERIASRLLALPNKLLCFMEPIFGWRQLSEEERTLGRILLERLKAKAPSQIFLCSYFFSIEQDLDYLYSLPVDGLGIDFYNNSVAAVLPNFPKDKILLAGIINTESTLIESKKNIDEFVQMLSAYLPEQRVYFTPNGPAELLPRMVMDEKIKNLQEIILCLPQPS